MVVVSGKVVDVEVVGVEVVGVGVVGVDWDCLVRGFTTWALFKGYFYISLCSMVFSTFCQCISSAFCLLLSTVKQERNS